MPICKAYALNLNLLQLVVRLDKDFLSTILGFRFEGRLDMESINSFHLFSSENEIIFHFSAKHEKMCEQNFLLQTAEILTAFVLYNKKQNREH